MIAILLCICQVLELGFRTSIDFALDKTKGFYHSNTELTHQSKEQQLI